MTSTLSAAPPSAVTDTAPTASDNHPTTQALFAVLTDATKPAHGRRRAREQLLRAHLRLAAGLTRRFRTTGEHPDDLMQVACYGLLKAIDGYDPQRGVPFTGYATPTILGELKRHLRDRGWDVRVPRGLQERYLAVRGAQAELSHRLRRPATPAEIAESMGIGEDEVRAASAVGRAYSTDSLNERVGGDDDAAERQDLLGEWDRRLESTDDRLDLTEALRRLAPRDRDIVVRYFYGEQTQEQIAALLGISQMHVSRLLRQALATLRRLLDGEVGQHLPASAAAWVTTSGTGTVVATAAGALDDAAAEALRGQLADVVTTRRPRVLVVDLRRVATVTTAATRALVGIHRSCMRSGTRLAVVNLPVDGWTLLRRLGVTRLFTCLPRPRATPAASGSRRSEGTGGRVDRHTPATTTPSATRARTRSQASDVTVPARQRDQSAGPSGYDGGARASAAGDVGPASHRSCDCATGGAAAGTIAASAARASVGPVYGLRQRSGRPDRLPCRPHPARGERSGTVAQRRSHPSPAADSALTETVQRLRRDIDRLRRAQRSQAVIEQAKGLLMGRLRCTPQEAFARLTAMSQHTNTKVVEVAAGLVGAAAPPPAPPRHAGEQDTFTPDRYLRYPLPPRRLPPEHPPAQLAPETLARYHLAVAAMNAATTSMQLAEALWSDGVRHAGASAVLLGVLEPDGAVRLAGAHGLPRPLVSTWQRAPASLNVAFLRAAAEGRELWLDRDEARRRGLDFIGDGQMRACLPLRHRGRMLGVAAVIWQESVTADEDLRAYVTTLVEACGVALSRLLRTDANPTQPAPAAHWVESVLDVLPGSVALLCPVRDGQGHIIDWRFDACGPETVDAAGRDAARLTGRRVLELYPHAADTGLLDGYARALDEGTPFVLDPVEVIHSADPRPVPVLLSLRAVRFGDGLLISWAYHDDERRLHDRLERLQRIGDTGWAEWDLLRGRSAWSAQAYDIFARDPRTGPLPLGALHRCVAAHEADVFAEAVSQLTRQRQPVDVTVTLRRHGSDCRVRFIADPVCDQFGRLVAVHAAVRRLTEP